MNKKINKEIDALVEQLIHSYHPQKIILFGSAQDKSKKYPNDIDILIIKDTTQPRLRRRAEALKKVSCNMPLDLIILTPREVEILEKKNAMFIKEILKTGTILYG